VRLGVFGGTFNPIHLAHLRLAEEAREALELDRVLFVPAGDPPLKAEQLAPARDRMAMVRLATAPHPAFEASELEIGRAGKSYTADTLEEIARERPDASLWFLLGADALADFERWHAPERIFAAASLGVAPRPDQAPGELTFVLPPRLRPLFRPGPRGLEHASGHEIRWIPLAPLAIAASDLRRRLARGASIRYLVPDPVLEYLAKHHLYGDSA
jgi:nicotinate-nucleotide adenylyltransferase